MSLRCADASLRVGEPLEGTAAEASRWLAIEERAAWAPKIFDSEGLGRLAEVLRAWDAADPHTRIQLIRRPRRRAASRRVYAADLATGVLRALDLDDAALARLDPADLWAGRVGERVDAPLHLVCTHGKRDECCALLGQPVFRAVAEAATRAPAATRPAVWQTSHLGGHRFAATLVTLPHGYCLGRVQPAEAAAIVASRGLHDVERLRGRSLWPRAVQAADVMVRRTLSEAEGRLDPDAVRLLDVQSVDDDWIVRLEVVTMNGPASTHEIQVRPQMSPSDRTSPTDGLRPKSCGDVAVPVERLWARALRGHGGAR